MTTAVREERKVLTAVFADVVGSTALAERLDPEDVKLVVGDAVARIVGEVESLGGHVKDLAGDGVLAFFGAPTTREDDAERFASSARWRSTPARCGGVGARKASACASARRRARSWWARSAPGRGSNTRPSATP
jgi:class 3 adenylate cyclase